MMIGSEKGLVSGKSTGKLPTSVHTVGVTMCVSFTGVSTKSDFNIEFGCVSVLRGDTRWLKESRTCC